MATELLCACPTPWPLAAGETCETCSTIAPAAEAGQAADLVRTSEVTADADGWADDPAWSALVGQRPPAAASNGHGPAVEARPAVEGEAARTVADIGAEFWAARPMLGHLRQCAHARIASPWAVLAETLARVLTFVPPAVQLPATVGGNGSLNLFFAEVAHSGVGKGAAAGAADDGLSYRHSVRAVPAGSGEGIIDAFATTDSKGVQTWHSYANLITIPEIDHLAAEMGRTSSTIGVYLRQGFMGEGLGASYRTKTSRAFLPKHSYRLTMTIGVQPGRAGALLAEAAGGTPQRFVWLPATDTTGPTCAADVPAMPAPVRWVPPAAVELIPFDHDGPPTVLAVCEAARDKIITDQIARQHEHESDPLETHANFVRLKVAAALALLCYDADADGPLPEVSDEYWYLAGLVMEVSSLTRRRVADSLSAEALARNEAAGYAEASRARIMRQAEISDEMRSAEDRIIKVLTDRAHIGDGRVSQGVMSAQCSRHSKYLAEATERLASAGRIEIHETKGKRGPRGTAYSLPGG